MANVEAIKSPKVSIIMPVKIRHVDEVAWLTEAVQSVKAQTFRDIELVIVDDGSQPGTVQAAVASVWDARFRLYRSAGVGCSSARNLAALQAKAPLLLPLDADDKLAPDTVERYMAAWKGEGFLYSSVHIFDDAGTDLPFPPEPYDFDRLLQATFLLVGNLHKRDDWERIGGWSPAFRAGFEDWDYWIRLGIIGVCGTPCPEAVYYYRRNPHGRIEALKRDPITGQGARDQLKTTHRALYDGVRPEMCCGKRSNGGGAASAPRSVVIPPLPGGERGLVMIEYIGGSYGLMEWPGPVTGTRYVFSADPEHRFKYVDPADLETGDRAKRGFLELRENTRPLFQRAVVPSVASQDAQGNAGGVEQVEIPIPVADDAKIDHSNEPATGPGPELADMDAPMGDSASESVELHTVKPAEDAVESAKRKPGRPAKKVQA